MKSTLLSISAALLLLFSSCGQYIYKSVTVHTPLLTKQHDVNAQINAGGAGGEIYAAYAPLNFLGVSAGYSGYTNSDTANRKISRFNDLEFSIFPFYAKENLRLEMPIGIGLTSKKSLDNSFASYSPYTRTFIQPTVGVSWEAFEMAFFCRISNLDYSSNKLGVDKRYEPGIMLRGASKSVKAMLQIRTDYGTNFSKQAGSTVPISEQVEYLPFHVSFGVSFNLNLLDFGKKKP